MSYSEKITKYMQKRESYAIKLLQKLVQEKSISEHERQAQAIVIETCREIGMEIDIWEPDMKELSTHPNFVSSRKDFHDSPNVVAKWSGAGGGKSIILNGHIDVVPEGDMKQWRNDPYDGKVEDGKVYGRGSTDMKGGNVALLMAISAIKDLGIKLKGDIIFQSVIEEESGGAGTLAAIVRGYKADAVIIPEPTNMKIFPKQQGSMWFRINIKGKAAHGGTRYEGVSALEKATLVIKKIHELEQKRNSEVSDPLFKSISIPLPINIGKIEGGNWPSSVPDLVLMEGRIGVGPHETLEDVRKELSEALVSLEEIDPWLKENPVQLEWFGAQWVPGSIKEDHTFLKLLESNFEKVTGQSPTLEASPWGTDGGLFTALLNTPTIVFGPGTTEVAHYPNEYIKIDQMMKAAEIIASLLIDWCEIAEK
ncbi:N-formyl-4-amino-5-aminomethyl-2-methylpyrimidinedeformylase [Sutcliffiella rhizosphaerae]|uniref:N-formyl-4-amino-5-aminomethyl-2-methylpyrimidine deformylase n=2 Tax=Sutcliffiella rhizosphaerae TaxID=2880967 RepID=A0ABM8YPK7_9BACI|nr:peptidase [Sutcliffiella rhizosphaerae]CAG9621964.1 N-formyl-4-amino-5-aminomethyl-2-methylpyrimidinedeformylase [Sutcliffiella rhizosphaerae]